MATSNWVMQPPATFRHASSMGAGLLPRRGVPACVLAGPVPAIDDFASIREMWMAAPTTLT
jgi:hypothetical protein